MFLMQSAQPHTHDTHKCYERMKTAADIIRLMAADINNQAALNSYNIIARTKTLDFK